MNGSASPSIWSSRAILPALNKKLGKQIKLEKKESAPATRIPLLSSNAVDLIAETMTDTQTRREQVDFSLTFFVTGAQFLVRKGSPVKSIQTIAGKRIAAQQGSTNAKIIREKVPNAKLVEFQDQPAAFQALSQRQVDAYTNDGIQLAGLKARAPKPDEWAVVGEFFSYEPYGMAMRKNDSDFRQVINVGLDGRNRFRPILRNLRQVVRPQGRSALPTDPGKQTLPPTPSRAEMKTGVRHEA